MSLIADSTPAAAAVPGDGPASSSRARPVTSTGDAPAPTRRWWSAEDGAATAEYAIVIMAAVGFAGLLVVIMRSDEVRGVLSDLVRSALSVG
jgi:Flp pilus assembly pilin Flp